MVENSKNSVFLFPGQGAQYQGMALDLLTRSEKVRKVFKTASEICGTDMEALLRDSGAETLKRTDVSQPAITLANLSAALYLEERGIKPEGCAGFSLGEYAALVCAQVISAEDCFRLVNARGKAMQEAADRITRESGGPDAAPGMAAVIGLSPEQVEALIGEWTAQGLADLYAANFNSPRQVVVAGTAGALAEAEARFKEAGARRVIRLQVAGPFHTPLIGDAADSFGPVLESVAFGDPAIALYSNVSGTAVLSGAEAKKLALRQITEPVRWTSEEAAIAASGTSGVFETGPGKVLQGLWKDTGSSIPCYGAGTAEEIDTLI
ncbi:ACP S-malonyltransferase [Breznakiella homolactica]|uniref:Malonyl CoA-acyl carrier protein transacylase n=1 Tax=Breznakiella homolactica TaxID=2798577 RepID=A0A7T7XRC2_9SPIR|nr:ACP S-malonyltransferase [Breznakiella homolactica]QQO11017.1 ACP S-malonyltransferase [Breznakiella homolactica]